MWQTASDFLIFLGWVWQNISNLLRDVFLPIRYIYTFLEQFFVNAFNSPIVPEEIWVVDNEIIEVFNSIPYFNTLLYVAVLGVMILVIFYILKTFLKT